MKTSEQLDKIAPALLRAQRKIGSAVKGSKNPFFSSKYADLGSVMESCKDAYNEEGVSILQPLGSDEQGSYVETVMMHESGQFISDKTRIAQGKNMQEFGAFSTYARRFGLQSMGFIPAEDDDGETAVGRGKAKSAPAKETAPANAVPAQLTMTPPTATEAPKKSTFKKPSAPVEAPVTSGGWE